jgi:hypothetical protein
MTFHQPHLLKRLFSESVCIRIGFAMRWKLFHRACKNNVLIGAAPFRRGGEMSTQKTVGEWKFAGRAGLQATKRVPLTLSLLPPHP